MGGHPCPALRFGNFCVALCPHVFLGTLAGLLILIAAERAHAAWQYQRPLARWLALFVSGIAAGLLLVTRIAVGITLPIFGVYVLWEAWRSSARTSDGFQSVPFAAINRRSTYTLGLVAVWTSGMIPGGLIFMRRGPAHARD